MSNNRNELLAIQELQKVGLDFSKPMREAFYLGQKVTRDALKNMESSSRIIESTDTKALKMHESLMHRVIQELKVGTYHESQERTLRVIVDGLKDIRDSL